MPDTSIPAQTRIGHVHLKVADLERAIGFYRDYLGFDLLFDFESAAFLSAGGYHHHVGLNSWHSQGGAPPPDSAPGLRLVEFALSGPAALDTLASRLSQTFSEGSGLTLRDPDEIPLAFA